MKEEVRTFFESVTKDVVHQLTTLQGGLTSQFHDVFIKQVTEGTPDLSTPEGRIAAFVADVPENTEAGIPAGRRIQAYVRTEAEFSTNAVTGRRKKARRNSNLVVFNIFDSGSTRGEFTDIYGQIEKGKDIDKDGKEEPLLDLIGNGVYELTQHGIYGKCVSPTYPEFYIYRKDANGKLTIPKRKRKNFDNTWSEPEDATARSRPMFIMDNELAGITARLDREIRRMHFVKMDKPIVIDESETVDVQKTVEAAEQGKGAEAVITPPETAAATGTTGQ